MSDAPNLIDDYMTPEDFFRNAKPNTAFSEAVKELTDKRDREVADEDQIRANETWSLLANQVVGQENF